MDKVEFIYNHFCNHYCLTTDSRKVVPGSIYLALKGDRFDGNKFANQALELGAKLVILDNDKYYIEDDRVVLVEDTLKTLQLLASHHRKVLNVPVIALTGSNGKTTTKELLYEALSTKYNVLATEGNFNNHIGVPLTILNATQAHDIMIVEMGANHVDEIRDLCQIALPDVGLITNIGKAHLEGFGGYKGVIQAKSEMYQFLKSQGATIVYNQDDALLSKVVGDYRPSFPYSPTQDFDLIDAYPNLSFRYKGEDYTSNLVGAYNLLNIATAMNVGSLMDCDESNMLKAINNYIPANNRSQTVSKNGLHFIMDAYNANPSSMELAIKSFGKSSFDYKALILGDMLELGEDAEVEHEKTINQCVALNNVDVVFVGSIFKHFEAKYSNFVFVDTVVDLQKYISELKPSTYCFVKGSRGIQLEKILEFLD